MAKGKTRIEKMDATLEEIMNEPNLADKIKELEEELKVVEETAEVARQKADIVGADNRDRDKNGATKFAEYKKEIDTNAREAESKSNAIAKKLQFYKAFKENGKQILNVREYQIALQGRLEEIENKKRTLAIQAEAAEKAETGIAKLEENLQTLMQESLEIDNQLKNPNLSDEERAKVEREKARIDHDIKENNAMYQEAVKKQGNIKGIDKKELEKLDSEIIFTKTTISKCNAVWTSLLKGKNWDEIKAILQTGDFTAEKGTINKIRDLSAEQKGIDLSEIQKEIANKVKNILDKKSIGHKAREEQSNGEQENEEEKAGLPKEVKSFAEKHPRLAKIPFLAKFMDNRAEKKRAKAKELVQEEEKPVAENQEEKPKKTMTEDKAMNYLNIQMAKDKDGDIMENVANYGWKEYVEVDAETRRKLMQVSAAHANAERYEEDAKNKQEWQKKQEQKNLEKKQEQENKEI